MDDDKTINNKILGILTFIILLFVSFVCFIFIGIANVDAASYSSYIWDEPSYIQFKNSSSVSLKQCDNSNICQLTGTQGANGFYINYGVSKIDTPPMAQKSYKLSIEFEMSSGNIVATEKSWHTIQLQVRNSATGSYTTATCDGTENLTITSTGQALTKVKYNCTKLNVSSTVYVVAILYMYRPQTGINANFNAILMTQNLAIVDLSDPNQSIIDSQNSSANSIISNNNNNTQNIINNQNQNTQNITNKLEDVDDTNKGILDTIRSFFGGFFSNLINGITGIFLPDDFDFLNGFLDTLENKLGFIASIPIQILEFLIDLVTYEFDYMTSITLPEFSVLEYDLWDSQEIDLTEIINTFEPYRIYTNIACVSLCAYYLMKLYENFASGGGN